MLEQLKVSTTTIFLEGMSLVGSFHITNLNKQLAINFQIEPMIDKMAKLESQNPSTTDVMGSLLTIFPKNGVLLKQQSQKIKVKAKSREQVEQYNFLQKNVKLQVRYNFDNNFNRILSKNKRIDGLNQQELTNRKGCIILNVEIGTDHLRIKDEIQDQVLLNCTLGKQTSNISVIASHENQSVHEKQKDNEEVQDIIYSLQINSKIKVSNIEKEQKAQVQGHHKRTNIDIGQKVNKQRSINLQLQSAKAESFSKGSKTSQEISSTSKLLTSLKQTKVNSLQLLVLAVLAGFFFALGSNFNHFIRRIMGQ